MSIDGKIAPKNRKGSELAQFMKDKLTERLHELRSKVDAIVIGVNTVLMNNPHLTVRAVKGKNPKRIVFDSKARSPLSSNIFVDDAPTILFVSKKASINRIESIEKLGVDVVLCGDDKIDTRLALKKMHEMGLKKILVEGGGRVRWSFLEIGAVDELFLFISPIIIGGSESPTLVDGIGFEHVKDGSFFKLKKFDRIDDILVLQYLIN